MTLDDYMLTVFCLVDDKLTALHLDHVRQRGFAPRLHDSEVLTIELDARDTRGDIGDLFAGRLAPGPSS